MNRQVTAWVLAAMLAASAALIGGCARRENIREDHGEASRAWFQAQSMATEREPAEGLDSEEAALILRSYRSGLGRDGRAQDHSQVLIIEEPRSNARSRGR
jgi:hypothetical protein